VYYCMEYMDCGSVDKIYGQGIEEDVLAKITYSVSCSVGLRSTFRCLGTLCVLTDGCVCNRLYTD
jgi:hypothetical protein